MTDSWEYMNLFWWFEVDRPEKFPGLGEARDYFSLHPLQFFILIGLIFGLIPLAFMILTNQ